MISVTDNLPRDERYVLVYSSELDTPFVAYYDIHDHTWVPYTEHLDTGSQNPVFSDFDQSKVTQWCDINYSLGDKK
jgi:hypothetical protein